MMKAYFSLVDAGCLMYEASEARWIIEHPTKGYSPTASKMWDVIIEHPEKPHQKPVKFMGSFKTKPQAINFSNEKIQQSISYFSAIPTSNQFYKEDYTTT